MGCGVSFEVEPHCWLTTAGGNDWGAEIPLGSDGDHLRGHSGKPSISYFVVFLKVQAKHRILSGMSTPRCDTKFTAVSLPSGLARVGEGNVCRDWRVTTSLSFVHKVSCFSRCSLGPVNHTQNLKTTHMSISRWMDREPVVYPHNKTLSARCCSTCSKTGTIQGTGNQHGPCAGWHAHFWSIPYLYKINKSLRMCGTAWQRQLIITVYLKVAKSRS